MHGILFKRLKGYVTEEFEEDAWASAMEAADIEPKLYLPVTDYPDDEAVRLVDGVVEVTGVDEETLLAAFGESLAPALLDTFEAHVRQDWDALDLLEHSDNEVFTVFHSGGGDDTFSVTREGPDAVVVEHGPLLSCELTKGVLRGLGEAFEESLTVSEGACVADGADACELTVRRA